MKMFSFFLAVLLSTFLFVGATVQAGENPQQKKGGKNNERTCGEDSDESGVS
jgi:hypothetical protein